MENRIEFREKRIEFHEMLRNATGLTNLYYQPLPSINLKYPCIVYKDEPYKTEFANGKIYILRRRYMVIFITRDPDDTTLEKLASMPYSKLDRIYTADNLYHYAFIIHH